MTNLDERLRTCLFLSSLLSSLLYHDSPRADGFGSMDNDNVVIVAVIIALVFRYLMRNY